MSQTRQLAAIMFTDIVGYTTLMQRDEMRAVAVIKHYNTVLEKNVAAFHGNILNNYGDGSLCSFPNTADAVNCALKMQQELQSDPAVPLRIGLHVGEIFFEDGKVLGDGVNVASRIQSLGSANTVFFSGEIQDKIKNHPEYKQVSLGLFEFKNVDKPVEVFALANEGLIVPRQEQMEGKLKTTQKRKSIVKSPIGIAAIIILLAGGFFLYKTFFASPKFTGNDKFIVVLPFRNLSNDKDNEYFSDGMTEEITTQLSKIKALKVIGRTTAMLYKDSKKSMKQIAEDLGVAALLEGSVLRVGNQVRINAQLIDAKTEVHIWANSYEGDMDNLFSFHSDVAQQIATQLNAELTADEKNKIETKASQSIAAYDDYLKGKQMLYGWDRPDYVKRMEKAREHFLNALAKDSGFALAWSGLSWTYRVMGEYGDSHLTKYYFNKSLETAVKAILYGPDLSEPYSMMGEAIKSMTLNPLTGLEMSRKAVKINPNNGEAYSLLAFALTEAGLFKEAETVLEKAKELDPSSQWMKTSWFQYFQFSRNIEGLKKFSTMFKDPVTEPEAFFSKAYVHFLKGEFDSLSLYSRKYEEWPFWVGISYAGLGQRRNALDIIDTMKARWSESDYFQGSAIIYAWMNEKEKAMELLEKSYALHNQYLKTIKVDKIYDPLRNEPRFKELLRKMGVEE